MVVSDHAAKCLLAGEGELVIDRGELAEDALTSASVVGVLDPGDDRVAQFATGSSAAPGRGRSSG